MAMNCINCQNSDRVCTYRAADQTRAAASTAPPAPSGSSATATSPDNHATPPEQQQQQQQRDSPGPPYSHPQSSAPVGDDGGDPPLVDAAHLELFLHFVQGSFLFISRDTPATARLKDTALRGAFAAPCLMHGILALAARHLAASPETPPARAPSYIAQAARLQAWAVGHFRPGSGPGRPEDEHGDPNACAAPILFAGLVCAHGIADLALPGAEAEEEEAPERFLIRLGQCFALQRGARALLDEHRAGLAATDVGALLLPWCQRVALARGRGGECEAARRLLARDAELSLAGTEACRVAVEALQCVLDEMEMGTGPGGRDWLVPVHCIYVTLAWPLLVPEKMMDLLVLRRPVALVVLAHYGATLDLCCRDLWLVGRAGRRVVCAVREYLGPTWAEWLRWPCEVVGVGAP
ncbi:hypothetical protein F4802DRAFT_598790 [Xylaria palmicola]|nr:hypothetical protein F4802DRAFT_598790 [Xylaria palmicola]